MSENLALKVSSAIQISKQEAASPEGSLERMALKLKRLENLELGSHVEAFANAFKAELRFFREISQIPDPSQKMGKIRAVQDFFKKIWNDAAFKGVSYHSPFDLIEGLAYPENAQLRQLSGAFFIAAAGDFSDGNEWVPNNRAYIFSSAEPEKAGTTDTQSNQFELRICSGKELKNFITTEFGKNDRYKFSLRFKVNERGTAQELFGIAAENMAKFSFGPGSCTKAAEAFERAIKAYESQITEITALPVDHLHAPEAPSLALSNGN